VALAKTLILFTPVLAMQVILVVLAWISGTLVMGLGPAMPAAFIVSGLRAVAGAAPLIAVQSLLSMLMRSFAAPVAVAFVGCVVGFGLEASQNPLAYTVPQGILSKTLTLGSSAMSTAGKLDAASMLPLLAAVAGVGEADAEGGFPGGGGPNNGNRPDGRCGRCGCWWGHGILMQVMCEFVGGVVWFK